MPKVSSAPSTACPRCRSPRSPPRTGLSSTSVAAVATDQLLVGLNEPQREAVLHGEGPLLILAGAGSGKTRVLTHRIAHLVGTGQARPSEILAITFTNKAAQEMRERVAALVGPRTRAMWVMTFHSACARMLRSDAQRLGYTRGFTIYDEQDSVRLIKRCIEELDVDPKRFTPRAIKRQISDAKNQLLDASGYREKVGSFFEQTAADVYELYEQRAHAMNAMDFDDLLVRTVNLLELFPEVRERYQYNFQHVLVDEYQDTNRSQKAKNLWTDAGEGDPIVVRELEDEHAEARYVAGEIERLVDAGGSRNEVAVFYRANAQSRVLEDTLVRYGVGYQVIGGTRFYERAEIKDALGYLTLLVNPQDVVAFQRVVNSPRRGIGDTTQGKISGFANTMGEAIWDIAARPEDIPGLGAAAIKAVHRFMSVME